jgi:hypothetical protein
MTPLWTYSWKRWNDLIWCLQKAMILWLLLFWPHGSLIIPSSVTILFLDFEVTEVGMVSEPSEARTNSNWESALVSKQKQVNRNSTKDL